MSSSALCRALILFLVWRPLLCSGYRIGDAVDTVVWISSYKRSDRTDAMRAQMPLFGISNSVTFPQVRDRFSLGFEEGLWALPWTEVKNLKGQALERLIVRFVYSKSGGGSIHAVTSEPIFRKDGDSQSNSRVRVEYEWLEEEPVDIQSGATVMFLATLVVAVIFLIQACGLGDDMGDSDDDDDMAPGDSKWN